MFAALLLGHALAYGAPACLEDCPCDCPPAYAEPHQEIRLGSDFFYNEGGVGPAYAAPVYSSGYVVFDGGGFGGGFGGGGGFARAGAGAFASASASASASARVSVRVGGGVRGGGHSGYGGHGGGKH